MINRLVYGSIAVLALLTAVASDAALASRSEGSHMLSSLIRAGSVIPIVFTLVVIVCAGEILRLLRLLGHRPAVAWSVLVCAMLMLSPWLCAGGVLGDSPVDVEGLHWQIVWVTLGFIGAAVIHLRRGVSSTALGDLGATTVTIMYAGVLPSFAIQMRSDANYGHAAVGAWTLLIVLAVVFASDIGALYVGRALGRRRLAPSISPGKSVAGFFGGIGASVVASVGFCALSLVTMPEGDGDTTLQRLGMLAHEAGLAFGRLGFAQAVVFGIAMSVSSQIGDLFESLLKRSAQVKDSSNLVPGMGGVLDVIDGVLFAVPIAWFLLTRLWQVV